MRVNQVATQLRIAAASSTYKGYNDTQKIVDAKYVDRCSFLDPERSVKLVYTRDEGMAKNWLGDQFSALDRCLHLSIEAVYIFPDGSTKPRAIESEEILTWSKAVLGPDWRKAFVETAVRHDDRFWGIFHLRVFAKNDWSAMYPESYEDMLKGMNWVPVQKAIAQLQRVEERL